MDYFLAEGEKVKLTDNDFVTEGGEGRIYVDDRWVYKIYTNPYKMIPTDKIEELAILDHPLIIRPQKVLFDENEIPIGFTMRRVHNTVALSRLFTNDFRQKYRITHDNILNLIDKMLEVTTFIHAHACLVVDGNEMNYLVEENHFDQAYFIDVDSYQTPHFSATAQMESIRDYHSSHFSMLTDWFAFAIVTCQLFVGIHPYKGKHPHLKSLPARMQANVSIFNKEVSLPSAVRDFSLIPTTWYDWFVRLFEKGERLPPPLMLRKSFFIPQPKPIELIEQTVKNTPHFIMTVLKEFSSSIRAHYFYRGIRTVWSDEAVYVDDKKVALKQPNTFIIYEPKQLIPLAATIENGLLQLENVLTDQKLAITISANKLLVDNNKLYVVYHDRLTLIKIIHYANTLLASPGNSWSILPHAHQVLEGFFYQNVLGCPYFVIPYGENACMIEHIPDLKGYTIISGKHDKGVVLLIGHQQGRYDQFIFRFNGNYTKYTAHILPNQEIMTNNFFTLPTGTVVQIPHDGELRIFHKQEDVYKNILDTNIFTTMRLSHEENRVVFYRDNKLYQIKIQSGG